MVFGIAGMWLAACGSTLPPDPPTVTITPTSATVFAGDGTQQFTATVTGAVTPGVAWQVNGGDGGNATVGTIDSNGLYHAPATVPTPNLLEVIAVSNADPRASAVATVRITPAIKVTISPTTATVAEGQTQQFTATVANTANQAVTWSVNGTVGGSAATGTISTTGLYTAPATVTGTPTVTVTATSVADPKQSASAVVTLTNQTFALTCPASVPTIGKAVNATFTCTVSVSTGTVTLTGTTPAPNVAVAIQPATLTASGPVTVTLTTASISLAQSTSVTITGTSSVTGAPTQTATVAYTIGGWAGHVSTVAGTAGGVGFEDGSGTTDELLPYAVTNDGRGTFYFLDGQGYALRTFTQGTGNIATIIGSPFTYPFQDGEGIAYDTAANIFYIADTKSEEILKYTPGAAGMTVIAGAMEAVGATDGIGTAARFNHPHGIALSPDGSTLYVADTNNDEIRAIALATNQVTTLAGQAGVAGSTDGAGLGATFCQPWSVAIDPTGANLYSSDTCSFKIRRVSLPAAIVTTIAGSGIHGYNDGPALTAQFGYMKHLTVDPHNNGTTLLYVADENRIRAVTLGASPVVYTVAGNINSGVADGPGAAAMFYLPRDLNAVADLNGAGTTSLFVADSNNGLMRRIDIANPLTATSAATVTANVTTVAGQPPHIGFTDGAGTGSGYSGTSTALFDGPSGVATDGSAAYVVDSYNSAIRKVDLSTTDVSTLAGGTRGSADGSGSSAQFDDPQGVALDAATNVLYVADGANNEIRKVDLASGNVTTVAGATTPGFTDGTLTAARFDFPFGIAVSTDGAKLYVADQLNDAIRLIDLNAGTVTTIAGGTQGPNDGVGRAAQFYNPAGVALDPTGTILYIADFENHAIRKLDLTTDTVTTIAGTIDGCGWKDGVGTGAKLCSPALLGTDGRTLFWSDSTIGMVRAMTIATGQVFTMAGGRPPAIIHMADGDYNEIPGTLNGPVQYNVAFGIAVAPDDSFLLITDHTANVLRIVK
jgi:sugar lactone lactonase YvrE